MRRDKLTDARSGRKPVRGNDSENALPLWEITRLWVCEFNVTSPGLESSEPWHCMTEEWTRYPMKEQSPEREYRGS